MKPNRAKQRGGSLLRGTGTAGSGLLLVVAALIAGCTPRTPTLTGDGPAGTYTLVSVDGNPMPGQVVHDGRKLEIRSGNIAFSGDGTCRSRMVFVPPGGREQTREVAANWTRKGQHLEMQWQGAGRTEGTVDGNVFTMTNEGMRLKYQK